MKNVKAQDHRETSVCSDKDVAVGRKVRLWWGLSASKVKENSEACEGSVLNEMSSQERRENNGAAGEKNMSKMWDVCVKPTKPSSLRYVGRVCVVGESLL